MDEPSDGSNESVVGAAEASVAVMSGAVSPLLTDGCAVTSDMSDASVVRCGSEGGGREDAADVAAAACCGADALSRGSGVRLRSVAPADGVWGETKRDMANTMARTREAATHPTVT